MSFTYFLGIIYRPTSIGKKINQNTHTMNEHKFSEIISSHFMGYKKIQDMFFSIIWHSSCLMQQSYIFEKVFNEQIKENASHKSYA